MPVDFAPAAAIRERQVAIAKQVELASDDAIGPRSSFGDGLWMVANDERRPLDANAGSMMKRVGRVAK